MIWIGRLIRWLNLFHVVWRKPQLNLVTVVTTPPSTNTAPHSTISEQIYNDSMKKTSHKIRDLMTQTSQLLKNTAAVDRRLETIILTALGWVTKHNRHMPLKEKKRYTSEKNKTSQWTETRASYQLLHIHDKIGVGAQSTLGGHNVVAQKICMKNYQNARILHDSCPKNYENTRIFMIFAWKINKILEFYMIFARRWPNFT